MCVSGGFALRSQLSRARATTAAAAAGRESLSRARARAAVGLQDSPVRGVRYTHDMFSIGKGPVAVGSLSNARAFERGKREAQTFSDSRGSFCPPAREGPRSGKKVRGRERERGQEGRASVMVLSWFSGLGQFVCGRREGGNERARRTRGTRGSLLPAPSSLSPPSFSSSPTPTHAHITPNHNHNHHYYYRHPPPSHKPHARAPTPPS